MLKDWNKSFGMQNQYSYNLDRWSLSSVWYRAQVEGYLVTLNVVYELHYFVRWGCILQWRIQKHRCLFKNPTWIWICDCFCNQFYFWLMCVKVANSVDFRLGLWFDRENTRLAFNMREIMALIVIQPLVVDNKQSAAQSWGLSTALLHSLCLGWRKNTPHVWNLVCILNHYMASGK